MKNSFISLLSILFVLGCSTSHDKSIQKTEWFPVDSIHLDKINEDIVSGKPTLDVVIYFPSNLDKSFHKVTLQQVMQSFASAKEIYNVVGVQLNLLGARTGTINEKFLAIQANEIPSVPSTEYANVYVQSKRSPAKLTKEAKQAFESIVEVEHFGSRTIYLIVLQDVFYPYLEVSEGRNWTVKSVRTGGLSFPTYSYVDELPKEYRGVITLSNLSRADRSMRTIAHEIGHKVMNVSHEYMKTNPGHEVYADGGLMLYGNGTDIPSGKEGRWHLERLLMSPFIYVRDAKGNKKWNPDYQEGGHYYDPIYSDKVIYFDGVAPIDSDW
jgi:hypothetical protein